jgi:hypothetical protein
MFEIKQTSIFSESQTRIPITLEANRQQHLKLWVFCLKTCCSAFYYSMVWSDSVLYQPPAYYLAVALAPLQGMVEEQTN